MNKTTRIAAIALAVVVVVIGGGLFWYLRDDAPAAVSLESATESLSTSTGDSADEPASGGADDSAEPSDATAAPGPTVELPGAWSVDTKSGEFDFESATGTFAGFRINETLSEIGEATAVGRTGDVEGSIEIVDTTLSVAGFTVDLSTITTNDLGRDDKVQGALETDRFPSATFVLAEPVDLGADAAAGKPISVDAAGDLTIHGVTKAVVFPLEAQLVGSTIVIVGSLEISLADFGVVAPTAPIVLSVEDVAIVEFQLLLVKS
ncbi:MAG: YceI family protein [Actinomycetota bacterium]|nr:YceI family protein [Actinomycetota bacterium]